MLKKRIIPCLDISGGRVVKGINFVDIRDAGDPVEWAKKYNSDGADELVFLDITATSDNRETLIEVVKKVSDEIFIDYKPATRYALSQWIQPPEGADPTVKPEV